MPSQSTNDYIVITPAKDLFDVEESTKAYSITHKTNDNDLLFPAAIIPLKSDTSSSQSIQQKKSR